MSAWVVRWVWPLYIAILLWGCGSVGEHPAARPAQAKDACPATAEATWPLPGTRPQDNSLAAWLARYSEEELDQKLLSMPAIAAYNRDKGRLPGEHPFAQHDLRSTPDGKALDESLHERLQYMATRVEDGQYESRAPDLPLSAQAFEAAKVKRVAPEVRVVLRKVPLRCGPYPAPLYKSEGNDTLDRNACSTAHSQEPIQLLARHDNGMWLVRTRYATSFLDDIAALSPPVRGGALDKLVASPRLLSERGATVATGRGDVILEPHTSAPVDESGDLLLVTADGPVKAERPAGMVATHRPLTRRALLKEAFEFLGEAYGFGGQDGGRDCSRLQLDLFESFDLALPRHSGWQAQAGTSTIPLSPEQTTATRLALIDKAHEGNAVLLYLPGHIMLYLGRNDAGEPMALHALGEYAEPCPGGGETVFSVRKVVVSDLNLGKGSSRRSLIERLTKVILFGAGDPQAPTARPDKAVCKDSDEHRIFVSPGRPIANAEVRFMATSSTQLAAPSLQLWGPEDAPVKPQAVQHLGGPPFTEVARAVFAAPGRITAALYDSHTLVACKQISIRTKEVVEANSEAPSGPVWTPRWKWEADTEILWSAFVENLFDDPATDETTWTNLHSLLRNRQRNLLFDHLGLGEDDKLVLEPDCADLPYMLRAYFAWKLKLPFGFRRCSRGRVGQPPSCGPVVSNLSERTFAGDVDAFAHFTNRVLRSGVHSASGRTAPDDDHTDLYPVPLRRASLSPGTVYADPYGHVMMVSKWYAQGALPSDPYGVLMAAEAQPDGTIGRRRFWEGSFLFDPDTRDVGAGFKRFRPLIFDRAAGEVAAVPNADINRSAAPYSKEQYGLARVRFYDTIDALINPRALDPDKRQKALVDALEEAARRRIVSVDNAIAHAAGGGAVPIEMPQGYEVFETTGPWEDFSTPARDMRLLIAIDTVVGFADKVEQNMERYAVEGKAPDVTALRSALNRELRTRTFSYTRSNGATTTLTLADVVARSDAFEMAYNPNDCVEIRWGAAEGSSELSTCKRHAPDEQRSRMKRYRSWFADRKRPPRGTR